jgi:hypothetical protein
MTMQVHQYKCVLLTNDSSMYFIFAMLMDQTIAVDVNNLPIFVILYFCSIPEI